MANLTLIYGMRLLPADEVSEVSLEAFFDFYPEI